jgi:uncharacterized membrane protein
MKQADIVFPDKFNNLNNLLIYIRANMLIEDFRVYILKELFTALFTGEFFSQVFFAVFGSNID